MKTIGAYEAKTHLPRLLEEVAAGETITITKHGRTVALLVPPRRHRTDVAAAAAELREFGRRHPRGDLVLRQLIDEGRRV